MKKIAAALLRVSSNQQELESQKDSIKKCAERMGYIIPDNFYFGEKISGGRPQFMNETDEKGNETGYLVTLEDSKSLSDLKEACQNPKTSGQIKMIFIWEISRLSRRKSLLFTHLAFFETLRKPIYFISHDITTLKLDTLEVDKMTDANISFLAMYIEEEYRKIKERTQRGKEYAFKNYPDRYVGGEITYGYKKVERDNKLYLEIDEEKSEIVRLIFDKYVNEKWSFTKIADYLNNKKIPSPKNKLWEDSNIGRLLHRKNYIGVRQYGELTGTVPAIISEELFYQVEKIIEDKREIYGRRTRKFIYPLKPIIKCGICRNKLQGVTCASRKLYYDEHVNVNNFRADAIVWSILQKSKNFEGYFLNQKENKEKVEKEIEEKRELFTFNSVNIKKLEKQKQNLIKAVRESIFSMEEIKRDAHDIDLKIKNHTRENSVIRKEIKYLKESLNQTSYTKTDLKRMIDEASGDISRVEFLIKLFIKQITIYNPSKNWVLMQFSFLGPKRGIFCLFNRQSKRNIYYTLKDGIERDYLYSASEGSFRKFGESDLIYLKDVINNIDNYPKYEYQFIQEDIFSSAINENERAKQKRWNEKYKEKRKQNKLNKKDSNSNQS